MDQQHEISLTRICPERNEWRFYKMDLSRDLFGGVALARNWGRIGTPGRCRLDLHPNASIAVTALAKLARSKRRRGYRDAA